MEVCLDFLTIKSFLFIKERTQNKGKAVLDRSLPTVPCFLIYCIALRWRAVFDTTGSTSQ